MFKSEFRNDSTQCNFLTKNFSSHLHITSLFSYKINMVVYKTRPGPAFS
jgi:hypothetical protein